MHKSKPKPNPHRMLRMSGAAAYYERETGERPHVSTLHRYASRGLCNVKLKTQYVLGCRRTTPEWIDEFIAGVTAAKNGNAPETAKVAGTERQRKAEQELAAAGI